MWYRNKLSSQKKKTQLKKEFNKIESLINCVYKSIKETSKNSQSVVIRSFLK